MVPIPDAIKHIDVEDGQILGTLSRTDVVAAQTPQVFRATVLRRAHAAFAAAGSSGPAPDDAAMVEGMGGRVVTVPGERTAIKITYPEDLLLAEALVRSTTDPRPT